MRAPASSDIWVGLTAEPLPLDEALDWAVLPSCGAVVLFSGTVRDHAEGRPGVVSLEYEAYEEQVVPRLATIAEEARRRWPMLGRLALLHRVGPLTLTESSVVVVASAPHRPEAFEAARFGIDTLKATVPIWKRETWEGGEDWGLCAHNVDDVPAARAPASRMVMGASAASGAQPLEGDVDDVPAARAPASRMVMGASAASGAQPLEGDAS